MADDYTDNTSSNGSLYPGGQATGSLETARDSDWFRIALTAGKYYTFELSSTVGNSSYQTLGLYNAQGSFLGSSPGSSAGSIRYAVKAASTGDFYVSVRDESYGGNFSASSYTLKAGAEVTDEIGDTRDTARAVALDQKTVAVLEGPGDIDYFKIGLQAGVTYTITPTWPGNGSFGNVQVEDASGASLPGYNIFGASSFTATRTGDHYIAVSASYGPSLDYGFIVTTPADDYTASAAGAGQLTVGAAAISGKMNVAGDVDWYGTQLAANTTYWFTLGSAGTGYSGTGMLRVVAEDGTVLATSANQYIDAGSSLLLQYVPTTSGKFYLEVFGSSYSTGTYTVRAEVGETDDYGNTRERAATLAPGAPVTGKLAIADDVDVFKLAVTAGKTYLVALSARATSPGSSLMLNGEPADYSSGNNIAAYGKAGVTEYRVVTAATSGDVYFTVGGTFGRGTGTYALTASEAPTDDYAGNKTTTGVLAVGGKVTGSLDYTGDADTFRVTLQYGAKYAFQLRGAASGEGTLPVNPNVQLQIAGTDQQYLNLNDNKDGTYTFTTTTGGDYFITVHPQTYYYGGSPSELAGSYTVHALALNGDTSAPTLVSHAPAANAGPLDNIVLRFSEAIMRDTSGSNASITLRDSLGVTIDTFYRDDARITINGDTLTINPSVQLKPGTKYLLNVPSGAVVDLAGNKFAGNELLTIDTVGTVAAGGAGNDYLIGLGSGVKLSGGGGIDTAIYGYERSNYDVVRGATATTVAKKAWDGATGGGDTLDGVERLMFANVNVALDVDGVAGQAYRLYRAAFDRAPDLAGIGYWIGQMDKGLSLQQVAHGFLNSNEFTTLYGAAPDDSTFVNKLYQNILHRTPDQGGVAYWLDVLHGGADRDNVLVAFSEGTENKAAVLQVIGNGFEYTPYG